MPVQRTREAVCASKGETVKNLAKLPLFPSLPLDTPPLAEYNKLEEMFVRPPQEKTEVTQL